MIRFAAFLALASLASLVGCAADADHASSNDQDIVAPPPGESLPLTFSRDLRPVDGDLTALTIVKHQGKWSVTKTVQYYDRLQGKEVIETTELITRGECTIEPSNDVHCKEDLRPVDGALTTVDIVEDPTAPDDVQKFNATLERSRDNIPGGPQFEPYFETIAQGLTRYQAI